MSLKCSGLYLSQFRLTSPHLLAGGDGIRSASIVGDVYLHPSAKVHPTAKVFELVFFIVTVLNILLRHLFPNV